MELSLTCPQTSGAIPREVLSSLDLSSADYSLLHEIGLLSNPQNTAKKEVRTKTTIQYAADIQSTTVMQSDHPLFFQLSTNESQPTSRTI